MFVDAETEDFAKTLSSCFKECLDVQAAPAAILDGFPRALRPGQTQLVRFPEYRFKPRNSA